MRSDVDYKMILMFVHNWYKYDCSVSQYIYYNNGDNLKIWLKFQGLFE